MKDIIAFFTKSDGLILDPFVGVGGTLLGAAMAGGKRRAIGIDLEQKYKDAYIKVCEAENLKEMGYLIGDARDVLKQSSLFPEKPFDLIIADPPYSDMMSRKRTGQKVKLCKAKEATPYTSEIDDLGNMDRKMFLDVLKDIMTLSISRLKENGYLVVFCKDFQPQGKEVNLLHTEVVNRLNEIDGLEYKGMRIWHDQAMSLYPFGYPYAFVMNQIHQYILIFRKVKHAK